MHFPWLDAVNNLSAFMAAFDYELRFLARKHWYFPQFSCLVCSILQCIWNKAKKTYCTKLSQSISVFCYMYSIIVLLFRTQSNAWKPHTVSSISCTIKLKLVLQTLFRNIDAYDYVVTNWWSLQLFDRFALLINRFSHI